MKPRLLPLLLATIALSVQAADDAGKAVDKGSGQLAEGVAHPVAEPAKASNLPKRDLTPEMFYQFLLAEIAGSRGELGLSSEAYVDLARTTRDPRVARRAAEISLFARRYEAALEAARLWASLDPESAPARQMITGLLIVSDRSDELTVHLGRQLKAAGGQVGTMLMQLNRMLARTTDKRVVQRVVNKVTEPYLGLAEAHFARAQAAHGADDAGRALMELDRALALRPDWEEAALVRSQLTRDGEEATKFLGDFVTANPAARDARLGYARALVGQKRYEEAHREFDRLLTDNQDNNDVAYAVAVLSLQLNRLDEAEKLFKRLIDAQHAEIDNARIYLGQIAEKRKQWDQAVAWYTQVPPGSQYLAARMRMAMAYERQNRLAEARRVFQESAAASPAERAQLLIAESQLLREANLLGDAYAVLEAGLSRQPDQSELLYEAALVAEKLGRNDVLERNLRRLIELKPDHAHAYNALGYSLADRSERLDEALQLIDKALALAPDDPYILDSKGWVLFRRGEAGAAIDVLKKALSLRADPEIAAHLGEVFWSLGRKDEARKTWNEAIEANPGNAALVGTIKKFQP
jgi:tetratricopeptide (TPR) repeat protein